MTANSSSNSNNYQENTLRREISRIASASPSLEIAAQRIAELLQNAAGARIFAVETTPAIHAASPFVRDDVREFLASSDVRCRLIYAVPLKAGGRDFGRLIAAFADPAVPADVPQRLARFAGEQLSTVLARAERLIPMPSKSKGLRQPAHLARLSA